MKFVSAQSIEATTNDVVDRYFDTAEKLTVQILDGAEVLIEGDAESLEFLANYILAYIKGDEHGRNISPNGPGSSFFTPRATHGLYIHILPCRHGHSDE